MEFWEAMKAFREGKYIRKKNWHKDFYWSLKNISETYICFSDFVTLSSDDWELYEEPDQTYSLAEVLKGLRQGKKFVRKGRGSDMALFIAGPEIFPRTKYGVETLTMEDLEANDWIEVIE